MGAWYTIGLCLGLGLGFGVMVTGILGANAVGVGVATVVGTVVGVAVGYGIGDLEEMVAGGVGGFVGSLSAAAVVSGAMRRGATRLGVAAYLGAAGLLLALLAFIPIAGYVLTVALPAFSARMRGRQAARFAGLRTLAK
jgi:hypothetical protein